MKALLCLVTAILALPPPVAAQPIHGAPQGVTRYLSVADRPWLTGQCHWKGTGPDTLPKSPLVPGIAHTHIEAYPPIWAELGSGPVTIPITLRLFQTAGKLTIVLAEFEGVNGPVAMADVVLDQPLPLVGDPHGLVSLTGHVTFDPATGTDTIPVHGWFNTKLFARTVYDNGDVLDTQFWVPYFSMVNPAVPEPAYGEGLMELAAKCTIESKDIENGGMGQHLTEVRGTESQARGYLPILAPFATPITIFPLTYNYKALPTTVGLYELRLDANFHMGLPGTLIATTATELPNGGVSNVDVLDPVVIAASTAAMGTTPGKHRLVAMWDQDTGAGSPGFAPNERLVSLLGFEVTIGPNPQPPPPPLLCTDPRATNVGGPLPCVFPPPPLPIGTVYTFTCDAAGKCTVVVK